MDGELVDLDSGQRKGENCLNNSPMYCESINNLFQARWKSSSIE